MRHLTQEDLKRTEAMIEGDREGDRLPCWIDHQDHKAKEFIEDYDAVYNSAATVLLMVACALAGMVVTLVLLTLAGRLR